MSQNTPQLKQLRKIMVDMMNYKTFSEFLLHEGSSNNDDIYLKAVKNNDMATAQEIVDQAARFAEYGVMDGDPIEPERHLKVYSHATNREFNSFDMSAKITTDMGYLGKGFYFNYGKLSTSSYGKRLLHVYLKIDNPFRGKLDDIFTAIGISGEVDSDAPGVSEAISKEIIRRGFDGISGSETVVYYPWQIKLSNPVVRGDDGKIIPPSKRFNKNSNDIRF